MLTKDDSRLARGVGYGLLFEFIAAIILSLVVTFSLEHSMNTHPPEIVKWTLLIGVPTLMVLLTLLVPVRLLLIAKVPRFRALMSKREYIKTDLGMNILWPKTLKIRSQDFDRLAHTLIREMSKPGLLHAQRAKLVLEKLRVEIQYRFLTSSVRVRAGLGDLNKDGKEDTYSGITYGPTFIEISAVNSLDREMIDKNGFVIAELTAFRYELLNALIWDAEGYEVAFAEGLLGLKEAIGNEQNEKFFARRKEFDDVFRQIDWSAS